MVEYTYNVWGKVSKTVYNTCTDTALATNPFMFKGYFYDEETGWFWLSSRYYSPELCRFISPDDIEYLDPADVTGLNLYCYCVNDPIMYIDPDGNSPKWLDCLLIAGMGAFKPIFRGIENGIYYRYNNKDFMKVYAF